MNESPVTNIDSSDNSFVKVVDANGKIYKANTVIVTASIGVLQAGKIGFTPALPTETVSVSLSDCIVSLSQILCVLINNPCLTKVKCYQ